MILGAIGFLASELGYLENFHFMTVILGAIFAGGAIGGIFSRNSVQTIYCIAFFYYFTQNALGFPKISLWVTIVTATLFALGFSLIMGSNRKKQFERSETNWSQKSRERIDTVFGNTEKFLNTKVLEHVHVENIFGNTKIYFDEADMKGNQATVDAKVVFGGVMLFVPRNWAVECNPSQFFGECRIVGQRDQTEKTLYIKGHIIFGSIQILYV